MRKMHKRPSNPSFDHNQYANQPSSHTSDSTMDIKKECTNNAKNVSSRIYTIESIFTISEITNAPRNELNKRLTESTFDGVKVKEEPDYNDAEDEDPLDIEYGSQLLANTIIKEEIIIECEPGVDNLEMTNTGNISTTENREKQQYRKRRKKVYKSWQKHKVFALESDALEIIKNEKIWSKYTTNRTDKWSKVIYRCRNVKSKGQQCAAGIYLLYSHVDPSVTLFRSINRHTCDSIESKRKRPFKLDGSVEMKVECDKKPVKTTFLRRRKTVKNWQKEKTFELELDALAVVKDEQTWAIYTTNKTDEGNKVIYRCRNVKSKGQQCDAGVYLLYSTDGRVTMYRSDNCHTCDKIASKSNLYTLCSDRKWIEL